MLLLMEMHNRKFRPTRDIDINLLSTTDEISTRKILQELAIDVLVGVVEVPPMLHVLLTDLTTRKQLSDEFKVKLEERRRNRKAISFVLTK